MSALEIAALTSYSMKPLKDKIRELAASGIYNIDLYCFCQEDLRVLCELQKGPGSFYDGMRLLNPEQAARHKIAAWCQEVNESLPAKAVDICGIASYVPDISSTDEGHRHLAVEMLTKLLHLMEHLRGAGFSCDTFEIVAGHTIQAVPQGEACDASGNYKGNDPHPTFFRDVSRKARDRLRQSLDDLQKAIADIKWPCGKNSRLAKPVLAVEVEPSVSKLVCDQLSVLELLGATKDLQQVCMNVDIGHMRIVGIEPSHVEEWKDRVVHCHVSDNARSHFADLEIGSLMSPAECLEWLQKLVEWRTGGSQFLGRLSIELEACGDVGKVVSCYRRIQGWLSHLAAS